MEIIPSIFKLDGTSLLESGMSTSSVIKCLDAVKDALACLCLKRLLIQACAFQTIKEADLGQHSQNNWLYGSCSLVCRFV